MRALALVSDISIKDITISLRANYTVLNLKQLPTADNSIDNRVNY